MTTPFELAGGSLVAEEYKGDYAKAMSSAERLVDDADKADDVRVLARALLAQAMVEMLAGCPGSALITLDRMFALHPEFELLLKAWPYAWHANNRRGTGLIDTAISAWSSSDAFQLWGEDSMDFDLEHGFEPEFRDWLHGEHFGQWGESDWAEPAFGVPEDSTILSVQNMRLAHGASEYSTLQGDEPHQTGIQQLTSANADSYLDDLAGGLAQDDHAGWAVLHRAQAELARRMGDEGTALDLVDTAMERYDKAGDSAGFASLGMLVGDWSAAPGSSPLLMGMLTDSAPGTGVPRLRAYPAQDAVADAERWYAGAFELFAGHPRGQAAVDLRRGYLASLNGGYDEAEDYADKAGQQFADLGDMHGAVVATMHAALYRIAAGRYPDDDVVELLGGWAEHAGSPSLVCHLGRLADAWGRHLLHDLGEPHGAVRAHELAAHLQHRIGVPTAESASYAALRDAYAHIGEEQRAARSGEQALAALTPALRPDHPLLFGALQAVPHLLVDGLFFRYVSTRDGDGLAAAAGRLRPVRDRFAALLAGREPVTYADLLRGMADRKDWSWSDVIGTACVYEPMLDYLIDQAEMFAPYLRAARRRENGYWTEANAEFERLLAGYRAQATPTAREVEVFLLLALKRNDEAVAAYDRMVDDYGAPPLGLMFSLLRRTGAPPEPGEQSALAFTRVAMYAQARHYKKAAAALWELERLDGADWWRHAGMPSFDALSWLAVIAEGLGKLKEAARWYQLAIDEVENHLSGTSRDTWRTSFYDNSKAASCYVAASRCALRRHARSRGRWTLARRRDTESFELSERGRACATRELLAGQENSSDPLTRAWREADARAAVLHNQLHHAKAKGATPTRLAELEWAVEDADRRLAEIERELAEWSPLFGQPPARDDQEQLVSRIARALSPDTAMLVYRIYEENLLIWAITRRGLVLAEERTLEPDFTEQVRLLFEACANLSDDWAGYATSLARTLLDPVAPVLRDHTRLLVVPSRALHRVPMQVLPWAGEPLVASHEITYLPAASRITEHRGEHRPLTAFGDPAGMRYGDGTPADPLPQARQEAELIASRFSGQAHVGPEVTRDAVLAALATPGVVHLASHGTFDAEAPLNSAVLLADGDRLTAADLMGAEVRADVVVLSACSTAAGAITHGEDVIGLPRALLVGGAAAVVATLWETFEGPSAQLVGQLYHRLHENRPVAGALRDAQNMMRRGEFGQQARHPGCWAPLIVIG